MKKLLVLSFVLGLFLCVNAENEKKSSNKEISTEISIEGSVTVYMIQKQGSVVISTRKSGYYNSDNETLNVDGKTLDVYYNSYYDDEIPYSSKNKACFEYVAGNKYYFNL